jgi:hypothetical protein
LRESVGKNSNFKNLIKFPELGGRWTNLREGGLDVYAVILEPEKQENQYSKCLAGSPSWGVMDVVISPPSFQKINEEMCENSDDEYTPSKNCNVAILIGTTRISFWDGNFYFTAKMSDLTDYGKDLFEIIKWTYGRYPDIVTLLDT